MEIITHKVHYTFLLDYRPDDGFFDTIVAWLRPITSKIAEVVMNLNQSKPQRAAQNETDLFYPSGTKETHTLMNEQAIVTVYVVIDDMLKAMGHASDLTRPG